MDGGWKKLSFVLAFIDPQRYYSLLARFLFGELLVATIHGMAPQDAVNKELAPPFGEGIRVPVTLEVLCILMVGLSAFKFIALAIFVDSL
jgi:hypothetical protein